MKVSEARKKLTHGEMEELTEKALGYGPFSIESITRTSNGAQVLVWWPKSGKKGTLDVGTS